MTYYYINKHEDVGHRSIKGYLLKSEQDFLTLAKELGKLDEAAATVQIFKPYDRGNIESIKRNQKKLPSEADLATQFVLGGTEFTLKNGTAKIEKRRYRKKTADNKFDLRQAISEVTLMHAMMDKYRESVTPKFESQKLIYEDEEDDVSQMVNSLLHEQLINNSNQLPRIKQEIISKEINFNDKNE